MIHYTLSNNRVLPIEYQEVSYLESTGTQWIDTEYIPTSQTTFSLKALCTKNNSMLMGTLSTNIGTNSGIYDQFSLYINNNVVRVMKGSSVDYTITINNIASELLDVNLSETSLTINGNSINFEANVTQVFNKLYLFRVNSENPYYTKGKFYSFILLESGILKRHFIPCYRKSDNKPGLFDIVEKKFYINQGSGEFLVGENIQHQEINSVVDTTSKVSDSVEYSVSIPSSNYTDKKSYSVKAVSPNDVYTLTFEAKGSVNGLKLLTYLYGGNGAKINNVPEELPISHTTGDGAFIYELTTSYKKYGVIYKFDSGNSINKTLLFRSHYSLNTNKVGETIYFKNVSLVKNDNTIPTNATITNVGYSYGIEGQYDKTIYTESDGSKWIRVFHHNNPANARFVSSDTFTTGVYKDADRWFDMAKCNEVNKWELMVKEKNTSDGTLSTYRFIQKYNPMTCTWDDVTRDKVQQLGKSTTRGGFYKKNSTAYILANDGARSNTWGRLGDWSGYSGGTAGYYTVVTTGYTDVYLRIDNVCPIYKGCYQFNGTDSKIVTGYAWNPSVYTVSVWVKDWIKGTILRNDTKYSPVIDISGSNIRFFHWTDSNNYTMNNIALSTLNSGWNLLNMTYDGSSRKVYINGELKYTGSNSSALYNTGNLIVGWHQTAGTNIFKGYMQDFRIYDYALTDDEIMNLYNMRNI